MLYATQTGIQSSICVCDIVSSSIGPCPSNAIEKIMRTGIGVSFLYHCASQWEMKIYVARIGIKCQIRPLSLTAVHKAEFTAGRDRPWTGRFNGRALSSSCREQTRLHACCSSRRSQAESALGTPQTWKMGSSMPRKDVTTMFEQNRGQNDDGTKGKLCTSTFVEFCLCVYVCKRT